MFQNPISLLVYVSLQKFQIPIWKCNGLHDVVAPYPHLPMSVSSFLSQCDGLRAESPSVEGEFLHLFLSSLLTFPFSLCPSPFCRLSINATYSACVIPHSLTQQDLLGLGQMSFPPKSNFGLLLNKGLSVKFLPASPSSPSLIDPHIVHCSTPVICSSVRIFTLYCSWTHSLYTELLGVRLCYSLLGIHRLA